MKLKQLNLNTLIHQIFPNKQMIIYKHKVIYHKDQFSNIIINFNNKNNIYLNIKNIIMNKHIIINILNILNNLY